VELCVAVAAMRGRRRRRRLLLCFEAVSWAARLVWAGSVSYGPLTVRLALFYIFFCLFIFSFSTFLFCILVMELQFYLQVLNFRASYKTIQEFT
jgi:hypothetical protein